MKKAFVLLFVLAITLAGIAQTTESQPEPYKGLFSGRQRPLTADPSR
mgnify:CR=1 FL=1